MLGLLLSLYLFYVIVSNEDKVKSFISWNKEMIGEVPTFRQTWRMVRGKSVN